MQKLFIFQKYCGVGTISAIAGSVLGFIKRANVLFISEEKEIHFALICLKSHIRTFTHTDVQ